MDEPDNNGGFKALVARVINLERRATRHEQESARLAEEAHDLADDMRIFNEQLIALANRVEGKATDG